MPIRIDQERKYDDGEGRDEDWMECPKCGGNNIEWKGGDTYMQLGRNGGLMRVDWYKCEDCAREFSETVPV